MAKQKPASRLAAARAISAPPPASAKTVLAQPSPANPARDRMLLLVLSAAAALGYYAYSTFSTGFYQQDEAGHFISMMDFWDDPKAILGNWAKWGYKLIYVVPALGGLWLVKLLNCLFSAGAALLVALALKEKKSPYWLAGFLLLALQPLWISLSFRNYSEIPTAFLLALAYFLHVKNRPTLSMLCISYICTIRQEFYPILAMYGLNLLYRKEWLAAVSGALFPLLQNLYGWYFFQDPLYLYNQIFGQANAIKDAYPRQGFDHYFLTSMVIFGPVVVTLFVQYLGWGFISRRWPDWFVAVPVVTFFLMQCIFNWQAEEIGPSTGGNLRYMLVISPLMAVGAALAIEETVNSPKRFIALVYLGLLAILTAVFLNYKSDLLQLMDEDFALNRVIQQYGEQEVKKMSAGQLDEVMKPFLKKDPFPMVGVVAAIVLILLPMAAQARQTAIIAVLALTALVEVRPIKLSEEDETMKQLATWFKQNETQFKGNDLFINHVMLYYFLERTKSDFKPQPKLLTGEDVVKASPKGSLVFWDSHFSYRPKLNAKSLNYDYFTQRPQEYEQKFQIISPSQSFGVFIFEKK